MVQGMAFLSKKGFNPQNNSNRKRVWEAQQQSQQEKERLRQRQEQLSREQEEQELERVTKGEIGGSQAQLRFMYDAPPGINKEMSDEWTEEKGESEGKKSGGVASVSSMKTSLDHITQIKPGDDDAAIAFRRMLAASVEKGSNNRNNEQNPDQDAYDPVSGATTAEFKFTPNMQGAMDPQDGDDKKKKAIGPDSRSALEKAVGRKDRGQNLSYQQQIERFPQLKNAPMAVSMKKSQGGEGASDGDPSTLMVSFKPLGGVIQHVRCLACGIWGHARGDRECSKSGWDPFAAPPPASTGKASTNKSAGLVSLPASSHTITTSIHSDSGIGPMRASPTKERSKKRRRRDSDDDNSSERGSVAPSEEGRDRKRILGRNYKDASNESYSDSESDSSSEEKERRRRHRKHKKIHKSSSASKKHTKRERTKESKKGKKSRRHRRSRSDDDS